MNKILKFGGSSIDTAERIRNVGQIIKNAIQDNSQIVVVVSAFGGVTNSLIKLTENASSKNTTAILIDEISQRHHLCLDELLPNKHTELHTTIDELLNRLINEFEFILKEQPLTKQRLDSILSYGELLSSLIIAAYLDAQEIPAEPLDARQVVLTDNHFGHAFVHYQKSYNRIRDYFHGREKLQVVTGFLGATEQSETTTLGRSGSDYTASIFGAALNADVIEIWTDVNGILTTDPGVVNQAKTISNLTYEEAMELAHAGAKVIFPPTMIPALYKKIPIWIRNTFSPEHLGTRISDERERDDEVAVGISSLSHVSMIRIQGAGMVGMHGLIGRIFTSLAKKKINIILVSQVFSEHSICFVIDPKQVSDAVEILENEFEFELRKHVIDKIRVEEQLSLVALVGEGMRHTPGISGQLFGILGRKNINVVAIAQGSSERNISFIVADQDVDTALQTLHRQFFYPHESKTELFLAGVGTVGTALLKILNSENNQQLKLKGVANSRKMIISENGIDYIFCKEKLGTADAEFDLNTFLKSSTTSNRKIFVDCSASTELSAKYPHILAHGFSIVTANKIANSSSMDHYEKIRKIADENNLHFYYEANVGAGLPVISTLKTLLESGDEVISIKGIFSGTLSYLFNTLTPELPFSKLVRKAHEQGFTEPDPRDDLNGKDVARKLLILAREIGCKLELEDIQVDSLLPNGSADQKTVEGFLTHLENYDDDIKQRLLTANNKNCVLRYIGQFKNGGAQISLQAVNKEHPFYSVTGSDNIISFQTRRYNKHPLVIKGAGAGAEVTAAGVYGDIITCYRIGEYEK